MQRGHDIADRPATLTTLESMCPPRSLHRSVESSGLMSALLRGQIDRAGYVIMQRNLHSIYAALEAALEQHSNHPALSPLGCARYRRLDALASDLLALQDPAWAHLTMNKVQPHAGRAADGLSCGRPPESAA